MRKINGIDLVWVEHTWKSVCSVKDFMTYAHRITCSTAPAQVCAQCRSTHTESVKRESGERERHTWTLRSNQVNETVTGAGESSCEDEEFTSGGKTWAYSKEILFYAPKNFNYDTHTIICLSVFHFNGIIQLRFPPSVPWVVHVEYSNELFKDVSVECL